MRGKEQENMGRRRGKEARYSPHGVYPDGYATDYFTSHPFRVRARSLARCNRYLAIGPASRICPESLISRLDHCSRFQNQQFRHFRITLRAQRSLWLSALLLRFLSRFIQCSRDNIRLDQRNLVSSHKLSKPINNR